MSTRILWFAATFIGLAGSGAFARPDVVLSNLSAAPGVGTYFGPGSATTYKALGFRTAQARKLDKVTLTMDFSQGGSAVVSIWQGETTPQTQVAVLTGPSLVQIVGRVGDFAFAPTTPLVLGANVTYWVHVQSIANPTATFFWVATDPSTVPIGSGIAGEFLFNGAPSATRNRLRITGTLVTCYADCDGVGNLTPNDYFCFFNAFVAGDSYANCDGVGGLTGNDFQCFLNRYVAGCS